MKPLSKIKTRLSSLLIPTAVAWLTLTLVASLPLSASAQAPPGALWYNGDMNGSPDGIGLWNQIAFGSHEGCRFTPSQIYDDFTVPSPFGWIVNEVFSDNIVQTNGGTPVIGAVWEIRQGLSAGNPGILIASGFTLTPNVTVTGRQGSLDCGLFIYSEYRVLVTGLNLFLPPGQYWLSVTPIGDTTDSAGSDNSITIGAECVGTPCGNNGNAFIKTTNQFWDPITSDFAMGVVGSLNNNPQLVVGDSVKTPWKIPLPINGEAGIEDRSGQPGGTYTITMTFNENIASVGRASTSCGKVASTSIEGATLTINLTKVSCNASHITVTANDVKDSAGINLDGACLEVGLLLGDVNGDGLVDSADIAVVDSQIGQTTNEENFRSDVNNNGVIDNADVQIVTRQQGTYLP